MNALIKKMMSPPPGELFNIQMCQSTSPGQHSDSRGERAGLITKNVLLLTSLRFGIRTLCS